MPTKRYLYHSINRRVDVLMILSGRWAIIELHHDSKQCVTNYAIQNFADADQSRCRGEITATTLQLNPDGS